MKLENKDITIDLSHHEPCGSSAQELLGRLTKDATISDILAALGDAQSVEFQFAICDILKPG